MQPSPHVFAENWAKRGNGFSPDHPHYGTSGFNDKLTVKDRHAYWDTGNQKTGTDWGGCGRGPPEQRTTTQAENPPRPDLRLVNRTVSYQMGSDATRNQDDLSRGYTWLGEQGSGWAPVYGGVPGLYQLYGTRGGIPYPIVSPAEQGAAGRRARAGVVAVRRTACTPRPRGRAARRSSPATRVTPQTRPVRQDRPSNSPQAGQSYSQTVLPQGASPVRPGAGRPGQAGTAKRGAADLPGWPRVGRTRLPDRAGRHMKRGHWFALVLAAGLIGAALLAMNHPTGGFSQPPKQPAAG